MYVASNDKILREEAMRRTQKSDILHSSGLVNTDALTGTTSSQTYKQRQEMLRQYVGSYDKSRLGAIRNPAAKAQKVEQSAGRKSAGARFDAHIKRHSR